MAGLLRKRRRRVAFSDARILGYDLGPFEPDYVYKKEDQEKHKEVVEGRLEALLVHSWLPAVLDGTRDALRANRNPFGVKDHRPTDAFLFSLLTSMLKASPLVGKATGAGLDIVSKIFTQWGRHLTYLGSFEVGEKAKSMVYGALEEGSLWARTADRIARELEDEGQNSWRPSSLQRAVWKRLSPLPFGHEAARAAVRRQVEKYLIQIKSEFARWRITRGPQLGDAWALAKIGLYLPPPSLGEIGDFVNWYGRARGVKLMDKSGMIWLRTD